MCRTRAATASQLDRPRLGRAVLVGRAALLKDGAVDPLNVNATVLTASTALARAAASGSEKGLGSMNFADTA